MLLNNCYCCNWDMVHHINFDIFYFCRMGDKEIKACLKEAREQIKNKDFKSALKECKKVLNKDKNNYMALVFCGLCLSELDQADQSLQVIFFNICKFGY